MNTKNIALYLCLSLISNEIFSSDKANNKCAGTVTVVISGQTIAQQSKLGQISQKDFQEKQAQLTKPLKDDEEKIGKKDAELNKKRQELNKEAEEITNNKLLSSEAKQKKFEQLQDKVRALEQEKEEIDLLTKRLQADAKRLETKLTQLYQELMNKLDTEIKNCVTKVAEREGWDIVEIKESKIYTNPKIDKTEIIIKEIDATAKSKEEKEKAKTAVAKKAVKN